MLYQSFISFMLAFLKLCLQSVFVAVNAKFNSTFVYRFYLVFVYLCGGKTNNPIIKLSITLLICEKKAT